MMDPAGILSLRNCCSCFHEEIADLSAILDDVSHQVEFLASKQVICQYTTFHSNVLISFPVISNWPVFCPEYRNQYNISLFCAAGEGSVSSAAFCCIEKPENRELQFR